jgi:tetratricopeptide (TPR) repeat protein
LLQTVRSHAARRSVASGRAELLAARHAEWFADEAHRCDAQLRTTDEGLAAARLESMLAELRSAFRWALDRDPALAGRLTASLHHYAHSRLVAEPLRWAEDALTRLDDNDPSAPVLLASSATRAILRGDLKSATDLAERAISLAPDDTRGLPALEALGDTALYSGQLERAERTYAEAVRLAKAGDDPYYQVVGETGLALVGAYGARGDVVFEPSHLSPSPTVEGWVAYARGELAAPGDPDAAFQCYERATALASSVGSRFLEGIALLSWNALQARVGDIDQSLAAFGRVIRHWIQLADHTHQLTTLRNLVVLLQRAGDAPGAAQLIGAVDREDVPTYGEEAVRLGAVRDWAIVKIGQDEVERLVGQGRELDVAGTAEWALARIDELGDRR